MAAPRSTTKSASGYFNDKKGEVNELKALLRNQAVERDPRRKREIVKKVIAYMTLGFDVSRLFGEMVMACSTPDLILKKMCYLYLSNYAATNEELATLCINTMQKDCQDSDPLVRGLALRTLSSLRLASIVEYLVPLLNKGLDDGSAYVRRNAVMAVLKLYHLDKDTVQESQMIDQVHQKIRDRDAQVSACSLMVLGEIMLEQGGINVDKDLIIHLLNRIKEYNEWGQCMVLSLVVNYQPPTEEEMFGIMNILDQCLRVANSAVVLATTKCFLRYADTLRHMTFQIYMRLKQPMLTLMASACYEIRYSVLKHVDVMVTRCPAVFDDQFKQFYCLYNEPSHVKYAKLLILPELTNEENVHELVQELSEYVNDTDINLSKQAITAFGRIALKLPAGADGIINQLLEFINMDVDYVRTQVVIVIKDLLRKYPDRAGDVLPALPRCLRRVEDASGKAAVIFMLGEFGKSIRASPYLLESVIDGYEEEPSVQVKSALLTAVLKLFFVRAPEVHGMLTQLLTIMVNDTSDSDLHDRALLYYRLLRHDVQEARRCIACSKDVVSTFTEERVGGLQQSLFVEFNTLSVVYDKPADQFIDQHYLDSNTYVGGPPPSMDNNNVPVDAVPSNDPVAVGAAAPSSSSTSSSFAAADGLEDLLGFGASSPAGGNNGSNSSQQKVPWTLLPDVTIDQNTFQQKWEASEESAQLDLTLSSLPSSEEVEKLAAASQIHCMASGDLGEQLKFFFFGKDNSSILHLAQVELTKGTRRLTAQIKSDDPTDSQTFADSFMASMGPLL